MAIETVIQLKRDEAYCVLGLKSRSGTEERLFDIVGESLLSCLYVKSIDAGATLTVTYCEDTGQEVSFQQHGPLDDTAVVPLLDSIIVSGFHKKPKVKAVVTGGSAEFSLFATVMGSAFIQQIGIPILANQILALVGGKDEEGKTSPICLKDGAIVVTASPGDPFHAAASVTTIPGTEKTILSLVVPAAIRRDLSLGQVSCRAQGTARVRADGAIVGTKRITAQNANVDIKFPEKVPIAAGVTLTLTFESRSDFAAVPCDGYLNGRDIGV